MSKTSKTIKIVAKVLAVLAGLGLILSGFALALPAQAQTTTTTTITTTSPVTFTRDLTIGSTGADVTMLQKWLISKGYSIPAGATGYFGTQTRAAVAAYQAANAITPPAGYFGPITRARVNTVPTPVPTPAPEPDEDGEEDLASEAIDDARDALSDARDEVEEADDDGDDIGDAEDLLDDAEDVLNDADNAFDDDDFDDAIDLAHDAEDLIGEALDEIETNDVEDDKVSTSAEVNDRDGADNDTATFTIEVELTPFNQDAYIARDASVSVEYEIQDANGDEVGGATSVSAALDSSADTEGAYFFLEEDEPETIELTVSFNPLAADEGSFFRLLLESISFNDGAAAPDQEWNASPESRYRTEYVYIAD